MNRQCRYMFLKNRLAEYRNKIKGCRMCNGEGYVPTGKTIDTITFAFKNCKCKEEFENVKNFILANIPKRRFNLPELKLKKRIVQNTLTDENVSLFKTVVKGYLKNFDKARRDGLGLMFFGTPGSGKTTAALKIVLQLLSNNLDCYYIYFKNLIGLLMEGYDDRQKSNLFKEIIDVDFLVIDELSLVSRVTNHMVAEFTSICKQRFENEKPTLLISNYQTIDEIYHNFGAPMESLLTEAFIPFRFYGKDMREDKYEYLKEFFQ